MDIRYKLSIHLTVNHAKQVQSNSDCFNVALAEDLAVYFNIVRHPELQPVLTAFIIAVAAIANGLAAWHLPGKKE